MPVCKPYGGPIRKLVVAFDIGTTFSGVSYTILNPGDVPVIQGVTRFPGQANGGCKIPSILCYTKEGELRAVGAEVRAAMNVDKELIPVKWFKLHLRPEGMKKDSKLASLPQLPLSKTATEVLAEFLRYLFFCTHKFIVETQANGEVLWAAVKDHIDIILSHPNGWEGLQQSSMRSAAIAAGLVPDTTLGHERVHFVSEGEASFHHCVHSGLATDAVKTGNSVLIIDAGGGTVDLSVYHFMTSDPITVEETAAAGCIIEGSHWVNVNARAFFTAKLKNTQYGNKGDIENMIQHFETSVKPNFKDPAQRDFVQVGATQVNDPTVGIADGRLVLEGQELSILFEPSIEAIVTAVRAQCSASSKPVSMALLVGGYAASPYLYARLKGVLEQDQSLQLYRPDGHTNKAVAEGSIRYYLDNIVCARIARFTYGTDCVRVFKPDDPEHVARSTKLSTEPSGTLTVPDAFHAILKKGTRVRQDQELSAPFVMEADSESSSLLDSVRVEIMCYRGTCEDPQWMDVEPDRFSTLCRIYADTSSVKKEPQSGPNGAFYRQSINVMLSCGLTELKANISWLDADGTEQRGPARVVYDNHAIACEF